MAKAKFSFRIRDTSRGVMVQFRDSKGLSNHLLTTFRGATRVDSRYTLAMMKHYIEEHKADADNAAKLISKATAGQRLRWHSVFK